MSEARLATREELERENAQLGAALRAAMDHITDLTRDKEALEERLSAVRRATSGN